MGRIVKYYSFISIVLYLLLFLNKQSIWQTTIDILIFNIIVSLSYGFMLVYFFKKRTRINSKSLVIKISVYSLLLVFFLNVLYYENHNTFFQFNTLDEFSYHSAAIRANNLSFNDGIKYLVKEYAYDDYGALFYIYLIYNIFSSTLIVNLINILFGVLSALYLFRLSKFYMSDQYAYLTSLSFFTSSYMLSYYSSGLKESFFIFLVISTFYFFYKYQFKKEFSAIVRSIIAGGLIVFFRPAVLGMIIISAVIGLVLNRFGGSIRNLLLVGVLLFSFSYLFSSFERISNTFDSFETSIELQEDLIDKSGSGITLIAAILAAYIGPLPTLIAQVGKEGTALYGPGLVFRVILSIPFWLGVWYIIRKRIMVLFPFLIYSLMGMSALLYILESYELRYHLTHLPFVYMIAFYFLSKLELPFVRFKYKKLFNLGFLIVFIVVIYWNLRL